MSKIMASPYKHPATGVYYFRMAVPKELVPVIGKTVFKTSLKTKDLKEAKRLFPQHLDAAQKQLDFAKLKLSNSANVELTMRDCAIIAERWYMNVKAELESTGCYEKVLNRTISADGKEVHYFGLSDTLTLSGSEIHSASVAALQELANDLSEVMNEQLKREGLVVSETSESYRRLAVTFYSYVYKVEALCRAYYKHDFGFNPIRNPIHQEPLSLSSTSNATQPLASSEYSISRLFERYIESSKLTGKDPKSLVEVTLQIDRLKETLGDMDIRQIKRAHIVEFRDTLYRLPNSKSPAIKSLSIRQQIELAKRDDLPTISPNTVKACLRKTSAVFGHAVELGWIDINPHKGVSVAKAEKKTEVEMAKGYTPAQINTLFSMDVFTDPSAYKPYGMACYWVPLLCRYSGSRVNEMAQLKKADIAVSEEGIHYINIRRGEGQSVKTNVSLRHIPIHEHLIELGFLEFVESVTTEFLFPDLKPNKYGKRSAQFVKWWSKKVKEAGVDIDQPSHAFRHSFRTALRSLGVIDSVVDAIEGHAPSTVGASYGTVELGAKKEALDRLPRLDIQRLSQTSQDFC
ncbi:DUF6538 domain-containing protein [Shewanella chilikensis]|uniref:DUF6538 domain-containing protein n=1 Tax=Shewanella chilikensis TaxID=558541 RepID=UPI00399AC217